jgi:predicted transcriptional regulator
MATGITIRSDLTKRLEYISKITMRSESSLVSQALEDFLAIQEYHINAIEEGIAAAEANDLVGHEEALAELKKWGKSAS